MKRHRTETTTDAGNAEENLCRALLAMNDVPSMRAFLHDLCTPAEMEALTDRWKVVPYIMQNMPYRDIHEATAVSITTICRVARFLNSGNGGYAKAVRAMRTARRPRKTRKQGSR